MHVSIDISRNIIDQFEEQIGGKKITNGFIIDPKIGSNDAKASCRFYPGGLELYHFGRTRFLVPINMTSHNPASSEWHLVHINLADTPQKRSVNGEMIHFHKHKRAGILIFSPDVVATNQFQKNQESEVLSIRFNRQFLTNYDKDYLSVFERNLIYEDLDPEMETLISKAVKDMDKPFKSHGLLLEFLDRLFDKLGDHDTSRHQNNIHPADLSHIFAAAQPLRNPFTAPPKVSEMANQACMGTTKFKQLFKMVFGKSPIAYHRRIRMEYARQMIRSREKSPSELSYELGFAHPSNFTAAYKKYFNTLPSQELGVLPHYFLVFPH